MGPSRKVMQSKADDLENRFVAPIRLAAEAEKEISCPFCSKSDIEIFSLFGSQLLTTEYYCRNCYTVFEHIKR